MKDGSHVSPLNIPAWRGFPLRRRLEDHYGMTTFVELDTKALALAEGWRGAARGKRDYLAMVVSTGIGGGLVLDGRLVEGRTGNAGHVGHVLVVPGGRLCSCGGSGCLEAEASGWAIAEITGRPPSEAGYGAPFFQAANQALREYAKQAYAQNTQVVPAGLGARAPLIGCAAVAWRGLGEELLATNGGN
jgi:glucokinase